MLCYAAKYLFYIILIRLVDQAIELILIWLIICLIYFYQNRVS